MSDEFRSLVARKIWQTSRADEGTISYAGANIIADALLSVVADPIDLARALDSASQALAERDEAIVKRDQALEVAEAFKSFRGEEVVAARENWQAQVNALTALLASRDAALQEIARDARANDRFLSTFVVQEVLARHGIDTEEPQP